MRKETNVPELFNEVLNDPARNWSRGPAASPEAIAQLKRDAGVNLPDDYLAFLLLSNGGEGKFGMQPGWFQLWPADKVLEYHYGYEVPQYLPGFFAFASSGGGDLFVFDMRKGEPYAVQSIIGSGDRDVGIGICYPYR